MEDKLREILATCARLAVPVVSLDVDADLYRAGLTSLATVHVMLAVEHAFDVEFPDELLTRRSFESISALIDIVMRLQACRKAA